MKVVFALRGDALNKPGGDSRKVERYSVDFAKLGIKSETIYRTEDIEGSGADLVHLMNLDLPLENLSYAREASRLGIPFVLSTIRHPFEGMAKMYASQDDRFYRKLSLLGMSVERAVLTRERLKLLKRGQVARVGLRADFHTAQSALLALSSAHLPMAQGELKQIASDFGVVKNAFLVPNGFSLSTVSAETRKGDDQQFDLVSVGRIEPRKNILNLVKAVLRTDKSLLVVGGQNSNHPSYCEEFLRLVDSDPRITYAGPLPHADVSKAVSSAKCYINPAWFEVVSQADIEAACLGLPVVSTQHSYLDDIIGQGHANLDPARLEGPSGANYLLEQIAAAQPAEILHAPSWQDSADALASAYESVLGVSK